MRLALALVVCAAVALPAAGQESALLRFGRQLYVQGDYEAAAQTLEKAAASGSIGAGDLALLGFAYMQLDRLAEAERALARARTAGPREPIVLLALGQLAFLQKRYASAEEHFRAALQAAPGSREARSGLVSSLVNLGVEAYGEGRREVAARRFRQALDHDPQSVTALQNLALLELEAGRNSEAAAWIQSALALEPSNPALLRLLVRVRERQGRLREALGALQSLSRLAPRDPVVPALLGRALEQAGRSEEALAAFALAEERSSEDPYPYYRLARAAAEQGRVERALGLLRQAIGWAVQRTAVLQVQAMQRVQEAGGKIAPADVEALEELSRLGEEPAELLQESLALLRRLHASVETYERDLRLLGSWYPHSRPLLGALGELLLEQARWQEALEHWEKVAALMATAPEAHAAIAGALEGAGRLEEARQAWVRALDRDMRDPAIFEALERLFGNTEELRQVLLDRSYIDTRNTLLLGRLAALERALGLLDEAEQREQRIQEIEEYERERPAGGR